MAMQSRSPVVAASLLFACACSGSNFDVSSPEDGADTASSDAVTDGATTDAGADSSRADASDTSSPPGDVDTGAPSDTGTLVDAPLDTPACDWKKACCPGPGAKPGTCCLHLASPKCYGAGWKTAYVCNPGDDFDRGVAKCDGTPAEADAVHTLWCCSG